jgi:hypothetical protein
MERKNSSGAGRLASAAIDLLLGKQAFATQAET